MMHNTTSPPAVFRAMLRDIVSCRDFESTAARIGLVGASEEVDDLEHRQAHVRAQLFHQVAPAALCHAQVAGEVMWALTHHMCDGEEDSEEDQQRSRALFTFISRTAVSTVLSHLLSLEVLVVGEEDE